MSYASSPGARAQRAQAAYDLANQPIPPIQQIVMLYEGAIRRIGEAQRADREDRIEDRWAATEKAIKIIEGLHSCLDLERGGEIAANLDRLYRYFTGRLALANATRDGSIFEEIAGRLVELKASWEKIAAREEPQAGAPAKRPETASLSA